MSEIKTGDLISIAFTGTLDNGETFMEVNPSQPMQIRIGDSDLPPTVENALIGLKKGDSKKVVVDPDEGYGPRQKDLLQTIANKEFIEKINPKPGMIISLKTEREGEEVQVPATVMEINGDEVTIDYNHPLAGHNLTYQITILDVSND